MRLNRLALLALLLAAPRLCLGDGAAPKAARSVHLRYPAVEATLFYNEVTVEQSQDGSYFCVCGFSKGYFGIQQKKNQDDKVVIFSVWEPNAGDDPKAVPADRRVEVMYHDKDVEVKRFGGEGTGAQSFHSYPWKIGETCRFLVRAELDPKDEKKTSYAAYFFRNDTRQWKHLATFKTLSGGTQLKDLYSFVEDFRRDGRSATQRRVARYSNGWVKTTKGRWISLDEGQFTADNTPTDAIDAAVKECAFVLENGLDKPGTTKLRKTLNRPPGKQPPDVPQ